MSYVSSNYTQPEVNGTFNNWCNELFFRTIKEMIFIPNLLILLHHYIYLNFQQIIGFGRNFRLISILYFCWI